MKICYILLLWVFLLVYSNSTEIFSSTIVSLNPHPPHQGSFHRYRAEPHLGYCQASLPAAIYLLKVNNRNTGTRSEICSKFKKKNFITFKTLLLLNFIKNYLKSYFDETFYRFDYALNIDNFNFPRCNGSGCWLHISYNFYYQH